MENSAKFDLSLLFLILGINWMIYTSDCTTADWIEQFHTPEGCIPNQELLLFLKKGEKLREKVEAPTWCSLSLLPQYLENVEPETSKAPFVFTTFQFNLSNAINVTIKSIKNETFIQELYLTARSVHGNTEELGRQVGRFIAQRNTKIVCCNYQDRNAIEVKSIGIEMSEVEITWIPNGDYVGPFVFMATIVNQEDKYWPALKSSVTQALE